MNNGDSAGPSWGTIEQVYLAVYRGDAGEIVLSQSVGPNGEYMALTALNSQQLIELRRRSEEISRQIGRPVSIVTFTGRILHDTIEPPATGD